MERPARTVARARLLALIAAVLLATIPLLPFYGNDQTIFSLGWPFRWTASYLIGEWASTAVIVVGVVLLTRSRQAMAAGVFLAVAIQTLILVVNPTVVWGNLPGSWWAWLALVMRTGVGILLILAVTAAQRASTAGDEAVDGRLRDADDGST